MLTGKIMTHEYCYMKTKSFGNEKIAHDEIVNSYVAGQNILF